MIELRVGCTTPSGTVLKLAQGVEKSGSNPHIMIRIYTPLCRLHWNDVAPEEGFSALLNTRIESGRGLGMTGVLDRKIMEVLCM
jgi:hypothetical protein